VVQSKLSGSHPWLAEKGSVFPVMATSSSPSQTLSPEVKMFLYAPVANALTRPTDAVRSCSERAAQVIRAVVLHQASEFLLLAFGILQRKECQRQQIFIFIRH
jgi:hypothetical protein